MQKKKGISLIVLVITIIVMIILAAAIIVSLNNNNIIGKAKDAVDTTNLKQVQELAQTIWADAYIDGVRTQQELYDAVMEGLEEANVDTSKYTIVVTTSGVTVTAQAMNEYGFYFEQAYIMDNGEIGYVFHKDGSVEGYQKKSSENDSMFFSHSTTVTYSKGEIVMSGAPAYISADGLTLTPEDSDISFKCTFEKVHGIYVGDTYSATTTDGKISIVLDSNGNVTITNADGTSNSGTATISNDDHLLTVNSNNFYVSLDGEQVYWDENDLVLIREINDESDSDPEEETVKELVGAIITPVEGSSIENIKAGNPMVGDTVEYNGYIYKYGQMCGIDGSTWGTVSEEDLEDPEDMNAWGVRVQDTTLTTYPDMESTIYTIPVKYLTLTFRDCVNMVTAPELSSESLLLLSTFENCSSLTNVTLPDKVEYMTAAFDGCTAMTTTPLLPESVIHLEETFWGCTSLTTVQNIPSKLINLEWTFKDCTSLTSVPAIPATVTEIQEAFLNCTSLTGTITINATNLTDYEDCFKGTTQSIVLAKTDCPVLAELAATAENGNVTVEE